MSFNRDIPLNTNRGKPQLYVDDYLYQLGRELPSGKKHWICRNRRHCSAIIHTNSNNVILCNEAGEMLQQKHLEENENTSSSIKCKVSEIQYINLLAKQQLLNNISQGANKNIAYDIMLQSLKNPLLTSQSYVDAFGFNQFPTVTSLAPSISRYAKSTSSVSRSLFPLDDIHISGDLPLNLLTSSTTVFIQFVDPVTKLIIMGTEESISSLIQSNSIYFATDQFIRTPSLFQSVFTLSIILEDTNCSFPALFVLVPDTCSNTQQETFDIVFQFLKRKAESLGVTIEWILSIGDYQLAVKLSMQNILKPVPVLGCYSVFCQRIYNYIQQHADMVYLYNHSPKFKRYLLLYFLLLLSSTLLIRYTTVKTFHLLSQYRFIQYLLALPFVPTSKIILVFEEIKNHFNITIHSMGTFENLWMFLQYFCVTWLMKKDDWNLADHPSSISEPLEIMYVNLNAIYLLVYQLIYLLIE
jgi:hypothetical protein